jgi:hypothetical protein
MARSLTMVGAGRGNKLQLADVSAAGGRRHTHTRARLCAPAVSRFICHSDLYEMDLHIDINTELFPLQVRQGGMCSGPGARSREGSKVDWGARASGVRRTRGANDLSWEQLAASASGGCSHAPVAPFRYSLTPLSPLQPTHTPRLPTPLQRNDKFSLVLAWTINIDATPGSEKYDAVSAAMRSAITITHHQLAGACSKGARRHSLVAGGSRLAQHF